jgi:subtilisin family serine protease
MYRVFGYNDDTTTDIIIAGMMKAANDSADVISMSLGSRSIDDPFQQIVQALGQKGIAIFAATGNDGDLGTYNPSGPAREDSVFAVGSVMNEKFPLTYEARVSFPVLRRLSGCP